VIQRALTVAALGGLVALFWWWGGVRYTQGYQAREIEVQQARDRAERAIAQAAQVSRQAAQAIRAAEIDRDRAIQEALDDLPDDSRRIGVAPDALDVLRGIR